MPWEFALLLLLPPVTLLGLAGILHLAGESRDNDALRDWSRLFLRTGVYVSIAALALGLMLGDADDVLLGASALE